LIPKGGFNFMWEQPNHGKKSVGIDIKTPGGRELVYQLAAKSDVFLTSFLPDARRNLRIDVDDIRRVNPKIIYARGSGQGVRGPDAHRGGYMTAPSYWARGGIASALSGAEPRGRRSHKGPPSETASAA
jgi:crotonobetainyl-CoA:carnitine CoA-transferase CaiB-like acyl-CoA transferase